MRNLSLSYLLIILLVSCAGSKNSGSTLSSPQLNEHWTIGVPKVGEDKVTISFTNKADESLKIFSPLEKRVEKQNGDSWESVGIRYCDCEIPCPAPPNEMVHEPNGSFNFSWDLIEEECIQGESGVKTKKTKVESGKYRVTYMYAFPNTRERLVLQAKFELD